MGPPYLHLVSSLDIVIEDTGKQPQTTHYQHITEIKTEKARNSCGEENLALNLKLQ